MASDRGAAPTHFYRAFGLNLCSSLPLPELLAGDPDAAVDAEILEGEVPAELSSVRMRGVRFQAAADAVRIQVDRVAIFLVTDGRTVTIARDPAADDDAVRAFLLGAVFGPLLHQRQDLVLQGSAVEWGGESVVFIGGSGTGKSTLAAAFRQRGHAVLADDFCVARFGPAARMLAYPSYPRVKLWPNALKQLRVPLEGLPRIRGILEKRVVPLGNDFARAPLPIRKLYLLNPTNEPEIKLTRKAGPEKFTLLKNHSNRPGFLTEVQGKARHFQLALTLAQHAEISVVNRPAGRFALDELVAAIEADLGTGVSRNENGSIAALRPHNRRDA